MPSLKGVLDAVGKGIRYLGFALMGLGVLAGVAPVASGATVIVLVGLVLVVAGVVRAVFGWQAWRGGKGPLGVAVGCLTSACGVVLVTSPISSLGIVTLVVAVYLAVDGVSDVVLALRLVPEDGWAWVLGAGCCRFSLVRRCGSGGRSLARERLG